METVVAMACAINVLLPAAFREAQGRIETLEEENNRLRADLARVQQQVEVLRHNLYVDRNEMEATQQELGTALDTTLQLRGYVWQLGLRLQW